MRPLRAVGLAVAATALLGAGGRLVGRMAPDGFDHWQHRRVFPTCQGCHAGVEDSTRSVWPTATDCATCHDGNIERKVDWSPPAAARPSNLRFTHSEHDREVGTRLPRDSVECASCHIAQGAPWMRVKRSEVTRCLACHGIRAEHLAAPDTACAICHYPLPQAGGLPRERIARFSAPPSHFDPSFPLAHGGLAQATAANGAAATRVASSCATCHARDFCAWCHVNAPEVAAIAALAPDARSLAIETKLESPPSHAAPEFMRRHGDAVRRTPASCATCHTQESCLTCHAAQPAVAKALYPAGPGRGRGAVVHRRRPASHGDDFTDRHAPVAAAAPRSCAACHSRSDCLDCHRPNAASAPGYHPAGFLTRHPASAYARETSCAECHNTSSFCSDCHQQAGLAAAGPLRGGFHDAKQAFLLGHGPAARQSLESCVSCHAQRDCLTCHSAAGGRRFDPHGPGFDPNRLRRRNSQMCAVCHVGSIPER